VTLVCVQLRVRSGTGVTDATNRFLIVCRAVRGQCQWSVTTDRPVIMCVVTAEISCHCGSAVGGRSVVGCLMLSEKQIC